ncbi:unnamed protein product [Microthlaspi erraticum]|uniref:Carbohydrate kinase PfkB domain-containing protein n=1 Tax=Microthlaspi erraticum TaxID=1685480 RepID=A0A6D2JDK4_9BRAS|nr:unnamed protein product [Microthlaspi erraticum]
MDGCSYKAAAGGSLSNTLVALARLGCQSISDRPLNVAMAGSIAGDPLGSFYSLISKTNVFVVEGYLVELPDTRRTITKAHRNGALVAVTAPDVSCIERHYDDFWDIVGNYADIIFANSDEAREFVTLLSWLGHTPSVSTVLVFDNRE